MLATVLCGIVLLAMAITLSSNGTRASDALVKRLKRKYEDSSLLEKQERLHGARLAKIDAESSAAEASRVGERRTLLDKINMLDEEILQIREDKQRKKNQLDDGYWESDDEVGRFSQPAKLSRKFSQTRLRF